MTIKPRQSFLSPEREKCLKKKFHVNGMSENIEAAKRTLMHSLCRNERSIMILGSLCATLIKIMRLAGQVPFVCVCLCEHFSQ